MNIFIIYMKVNPITSSNGLLTVTNGLLGH